MVLTIDRPETAKRPFDDLLTDPKFGECTRHGASAACRRCSLSRKIDMLGDVSTTVIKMLGQQK
jgi:hypothetical protein